MVWGGSDADAPAVNEVANKVRQYEDSLSRPLTVAAVEKLAKKMTEKTIEKMTKRIAKQDEEMAKKNYKLFEKLIEKLSGMEKESHSSPEQTHIAVIKKKHPPTRLTQEKQDSL
ncbi:hypothetical protein llap_18191 [Limosa lapponica baueri]|uniref:Uncharacterized protein n=1 Tax=Limosa lapponica baueri TaxID=1758121 RepID=A0A2I0TCN1_LIMLA|nr:hypothetical protein llap_18191 [Limosa lapponica baueri]